MFSSTNQFTRRQTDCGQTTFSRWWSVVTAILYLIPLFFLGCDIPERVSLQRPDKDLEIASAESLFGEKKIQNGSTAPFKGNWDAWDAWIIENEHVGYQYTEAKSTGSENDAISFKIEDCLIVTDGLNAAYVQRHEHQWMEQSNGNLIQFETKLSVGPLVTEISGKKVDSELNITKHRDSVPSSKRITVNENLRGLCAAEESLRREPMKVGDRRVLHALLPLEQTVVTQKLNCVILAPVPVSLSNSEYRSLLEIEVETDLGKQGKTYSTLWTETDGTVVRSQIGTSFLYRVDEPTATASLRELENEVSVASTVIQGKLERSSETTQVGFRLNRTNQPLLPNQLPINAQPNQSIRTLDASSLLLLVSSTKVSPNHNFKYANLRATQADIKPSVFVDSNAAEVQRISRAAVGKSHLSEREMAIELTRTVNRLTQLNPAPALFPKASSIAKAAEGDSTGFAVLLAALLRANKIPSRIAFGFRYQDGDQPRMVFHAWTLASIDGEWLALDATSGELASADRITITTSDLGDGDVENTLKPVLDFLGTYNIEIVSSATRY